MLRMCLKKSDISLSLRKMHTPHPPGILPCILNMRGHTSTCASWAAIARARPAYLAAYRDCIRSGPRSPSNIVLLAPLRPLPPESGWSRRRRAAR